MATTLHDVGSSDSESLEVIRALFEEYATELGVNLCFQGFVEELDNLPGKYSAPRGALFLLRVGDAPAGCVALRPLGTDTCELKRLFVTPAFRGTGLGNQLLDAAIDRARELGYQHMKLDTLARLEKAGGMYRRRGFQQCESYNVNPEPDIEYWTLDLRAVGPFRDVERTAPATSPRNGPITDLGTPIS